MHAELRQAYDREMHAATEYYDGNNLEKAFSHLERAHILGQSFTCPYARAHWWMLKVGWNPETHQRSPAKLPGFLGR